MTLLEIQGLEASYDQIKVLHGLDFEIAERGITTILGANGAGKTTVLRAICAMVRTAGSIRFDGVEITKMPTEDIARLGIAHVPDGRGTFLRLTVEENLRVAAITRKNRQQVKQESHQIYQHFPILQERRLQQAGTLSGGEQQMLAIGRALMLKPRLMLLDEPSFGLAPLVTQRIFEILKEINQTAGVGILLVEQNATLALDLASHAYLIETGRVIMSGSARQFRDDESIRRSYLGY